MPKNTKKDIDLCNCVCIFTCFYSKFDLICNFYEGFLKGRRATTHKNRVAHFGRQMRGKVCFATGQGPSRAYYAVKVAKGAKVPSRAAGGARPANARQSVTWAILKTRLEPLMIGIIFGE